MGLVIADMSMSLDGFIADSADQVGPLFDWYGNGDVEFAFPGNGMRSQVSAASAAHLRAFVPGLGALICGRRLYDLTGGWQGSHPVGVPIVVLTHAPPETVPAGSTPFTFVTSGVQAAIAAAQEIAGDLIVAVASANVAQQCLDAGCLDAIQVSLVPVILGDGIPFFANLRRHPVRLEDPEMVQGERVMHMLFKVGT
jgi:dihydrofolate reductase